MHGCLFGTGNIEGDKEMKIKEGVVMPDKIEIRPVLVHAEALWRSFGREEGVPVTSGKEGTHSAASLHYTGYAVDLRTRYFDDFEKNKIHSMLEQALGKKYRVISHDTHIHVEYRDVVEEFKR